jgi:hypothetical protein
MARHLSRRNTLISVWTLHASPRQSKASSRLQFIRSHRPRG